MLTIYFTVQALRVLALKSGVSFNPCATCTSFGLVWLSALLFNYLPPVIIGFLMGASALAVATKFKEYADLKGWEGLPYKTLMLYLLTMLAFGAFTIKKWL